MNQISLPTPLARLAPSEPSVPSVPSVPSAPLIPTARPVGNKASLISHALSLSLSGKLQTNVRRSSPGSDFIDKITSIFEKICTNMNKQLDDLNGVQRERQAAMHDLMAVRDALAMVRLTLTDPKKAVDLKELTIVVSPNSPLANGGKTGVALTTAMDYYCKEHDELGLPRTPTTANELESYLDHIDTSLKMVLEPASQDAHTEMERITQQSRAMEQLQAMLYQIYYDALRKFTNAS